VIISKKGHTVLHAPVPLACLCAVLWAAGGALADEPQAWSPPVLVASAWAVADDAVLDALRGGFEIPSLIPGLAVSFGFVRTVTINGDLVSQARFQLPDLSRISVDQARQVSDALAQAKLVQNGLGNSVSGAAVLPALAGATVVQNTLSNQAIQTLTQIDAGVNSLGILRSINTRGALQDALIGALGVR
jgi:hypothetical protein